MSALAPRRLAVLDGPHLAHADEFGDVAQRPGVELVWVRTPTELAEADCVVLPGTSRPSQDLAWMRAQGLDRAVARHAEQGGAVLATGRGLHLLGEALIDLHDVSGNAPGLGLLALVSQVDPSPDIRHTASHFTQVLGPWQALSGLEVRGLEVAHGQTAMHPAMHAAGHQLHEVMPGLAWQNAQGQVLGLLLHGLLQQPEVLEALFGAA